MNNADKHTDQVMHYHETTKHYMHRYASGPDALDWDDQPEAFRWFEGTHKVELPLKADDNDTPYIRLYQPGGVAPQPLSIDNIATVFELSFGLSAWKQYGDSRWALRCNPSSGNLHPTEAYAITNNTDSISAGIHHYLSRDHLLEQRCRFNSDLLAKDTFLIGLSSIHWREAWKYGERAFRYCQLDVGHAIAAVRYAAATLGWSVQIMDHVNDVQLATLLGLNRSADFDKAEAEHADVLLKITTHQNEASVELAQLIDAANSSEWYGKANVLSERHLYNWPIIDDVARTTEKPTTEKAAANQYDFSEPLNCKCSLEASLLIRRRRSAQAFDGQTIISSDAFFRILDMTLPRSNVAPWDCTPWRDAINLVVFVHRVEGLKPGLYSLVRNPQTFDTFKQALEREQFQWQTVEGCPQHLPFFTLVNANGQKLATTLSCHQGIAGQSCFSLGMIADCASTDSQPWNYRRLYWEAGMIGQVLYLEAEAAGIQGTGIGCYFDDSVHEALGITDKRWQSLYHFTVGKGVQDGRIQTIPPYGHINR